MGRSVAAVIGKKELGERPPKRNHAINQSQQFAAFIPYPSTKQLQGRWAFPLPFVSSVPSHTACPHLWSQRGPVRQLSPPSLPHEHGQSSPRSCRKLLGSLPQPGCGSALRHCGSGSEPPSLLAVGICSAVPAGRVPTPASLALPVEPLTACRLHKPRARLQ